MTEIKKSNFIVILLASTAYFTFVLMDSLAKHLTSIINIDQLIWGRYFFHFLSMLIFFLIFKPKLNLKKNFKLQILRSSLLVLGTLCMFVSLKYFNLVDIYILYFSSPLILALLSAFFLKDKLSGMGWILMILSFISIVWAIGPEMKTFSPQLLIPLSIPIVWAFYQYLTKIISVNREPFVAVFYSGIVGTVIFSLYTFVNWIPFNSYMVWLQLIVLGTFGFISHIVLVYAIQLSNLSFVANFQYSQLVWSSIVSFLIFGVPIEINRLFGMVAIIIFGVLFIKFELSKKIN
ncbi:MAG: DMT family transporter [Candidatus Fonsibacter sp.]|nr:DMT family transporter [Pelagibacterales bacterium]